MGATLPAAGATHGKHADLGMWASRGGEKERAMSRPEPEAGLHATIDRLALAVEVADEPLGFVRVLEGAAPPPASPPPAPEPRR